MPYGLMLALIFVVGIIISAACSFTAVTIWIYFKRRVPQKYHYEQVEKEYQFHLDRSMLDEPPKAGVDGMRGKDML